MHISGATAVTLLFGAATSFNGFDKSPGRDGRDPSLLAAGGVRKASCRTFDELRHAHITDYAALFKRVELDLGPSAAPENMPTDRRIAEFGAKDPKLVELLFHYGRYLMIASSRPGSQPANLQGIWNPHVRPPWSCNWTLNINAQMNYWPAEVCDLPECHEPLLKYIGGLAQNGKKTAEIHYGCRGWTAHHNGDIWRQTAPAGDYGHGDPVWAIWPMGAAWLSRHLWEHYAFGGDEQFLRDDAYPLMKEAAYFCLDWLVENEEGRLVTVPSTSPEHKFITPDGQVSGVGMSATMDISIIRDLFSNCLAAAEILGVDGPFRKEISAVMEKLYPFQIGRRGQLAQRLGRRRCASPARLASVRRVSGTPTDRKRYARTFRCGQTIAGKEGRRRYRLEFGVEDMPVGQIQGREQGAEADRQFVAPGGRRCGRLSPRGRLSQSVRCPSPFSN